MSEKCQNTATEKKREIKPSILRTIDDLLDKDDNRESNFDEAVQSLAGQLRVHNKQRSGLINIH